MNFYQFSLKTAKEKYLKFKSRLEKSISSGKFDSLPRRKKNILISRVEKYRKRIESFGLSSKDLAVAGSVAAAVAVPQSISAQAIQAAAPSSTLFYEKSDNRFSFSCMPSKVELANLDSDPKLEIIASACNGNITNISDNGFFSNSSPSALNNMSGEFVIGDIDGDEDNDIIFQGFAGMFYAAFNDGEGNFTLSEQEYDPFMSAPYIGAFGGEGSDTDLALVDFDVDGDLDLVVAATDQSDLFYFTNDGDGLFSTKETLTVGQPGLTSFEFADMDGDGDLDLIHNVSEDFNANEIDEGAVRVVENTAGIDAIPQLDGTSEFIAYAGDGDLIDLITTFDGDGDGDFDVFFTRDDFPYLGMQENREDEGESYHFQFNTIAETGFPTSFAATDVAVADFDNDGDDDLMLVFNNYTPYFASFDGTNIVGDDNLGDVTSSFWSDVAVGDIDGDGYIDFIGDPGFAPKYMYYDRSFPSFEGVSSGSVIIDENTSVGSTVGTVGFSDPNGDDVTANLIGDNADLFSLDGSTGEITTAKELDWEELGSNLDVQIELSDPTKSFTESLPLKINNLPERGDGVISEEPLNLFGNYRPDAFEPGDIDMDGDADLFLSHSSNGPIGSFNNLNRVFNQLGEGSFLEQVAYIDLGGDGYQTYSAVLHDFDNDGDLDVIGNTYYYLILSENINGVFDGENVLPQDVSVRVGYDIKGLELGDFNGDGIKDIAVLGEDQTYSGDNLFVMNGSASGDFSLETDILLNGHPSNPELVTGNPNAIGIADFDGDGYDDVFLSTTGGSDYIFYGTSSGISSVPIEVISDADYGLSKIAIADFDGDGTPDIGILRSSSASGADDLKLDIHLNDDAGIGNFDFTKEPEVTVGGEDSGNITVGDIDGDGSPDIITSSFYSENLNRNLKFWENDGSGSFSETQRIEDIDGRELQLMDIDGDDDLDILVDQRFEVEGGEGTFSRVVVFKNENVPPSDLMLSSSTVDEHADLDTPIGTFSATDLNPNDTPVFTLVEGNGTNDEHNDYFKIVDGELQVNREIRFEDLSSLNIFVSADDGFNAVTQAFTITVNDINQAPTAINLSSSSFDESVTGGTSIATLSATDANPGDSHGFSLITGDGSNDADNDKFAIEGDQLILLQTVKQEDQGSLNVNLQVEDEYGEALSEAFTLTVNNVNSAPTGVQLSSDNFNESVSPGTAIATLTADDVDGSDSHSFNLTDGDGSNDADNDRFAIEGDQLILLQAVSAESQSTVNIYVSTTDSFGELAESALTLTVNNVGNAPTGIQLSADNFDEGIAAGSVVATLTADDVDATDTHTFTLVAGDGSNDADNDKFVIDGNELVLLESIFAESQGTVSINLSTTDSNGESFDEAFTLTVNNVNTAPTGVALSASSFDETVESGTSVATLTASDVDTGDSHTFSLSEGDGVNDADNDKFSISGDQLILLQSISAESQNSVSVYVTTTDSFGESASQAVTLTVNNVNNAPTGVLLSTDNFDEDTASGSSVATLTANDDAGDSNTFSLATGDGSNDADNDKFAIEGDQLILLQSIASESQGTVNIYVTTTDSFGESASTAFTLTVNNVNSVPTGIELSTDNFDENTAIGTAVATISAIDSDTDDIHEFELASGDGTNDADNGSFIINGNQLIISESTKFEIKPSYNIYIAASDSEGSVEQAFVINVNDVNQGPVSISLSTTSVDESATPGTTVATISGVDPNAGDVLSFELVEGDGTNDTHNDLFLVVDNNLVLIDDIEFDVLKSLNINLRVSDGDESHDQSFTLIVNEVLGIADEVNNTLGIYPNPGNDRLQINLENDMKGDLSIIISDLSGRVVKELSVTKNARKFSYPVDMTSAQVGIYLVELRSEQGTISQRWVKK